MDKQKSDFLMEIGFSVHYEKKYRVVIHYIKLVFIVMYTKTLKLMNYQ